MTTLVGARSRSAAERRFYTGMALIVLASVFLGFCPAAAVSALPDDRSGALRRLRRVRHPLAPRYAEPQAFHAAGHDRVAGCRGHSLALWRHDGRHRCSPVDKDRHLRGSLFLVPMIIWDIVSRGRVHRVTLIGGLAVIASQPLRVLLSETTIWMRVAGWAIQLVGK